MQNHALQARIVLAIVCCTKVIRAHRATWGRKCITLISVSIFSCFWTRNFGICQFLARKCGIGVEKDSLQGFVFLHRICFLNLYSCLLSLTFLKFNEKTLFHVASCGPLLPPKIQPNEQPVRLSALLPHTLHNQSGGNRTKRHLTRSLFLP